MVSRDKRPKNYGVASYMLYMLLKLGDGVMERLPKVVQ